MAEPTNAQPPQKVANFRCSAPRVRVEGPILNDTPSLGYTEFRITTNKSILFYVTVALSRRKNEEIKDNLDDGGW